MRQTTVRRKATKVVKVSEKVINTDMAKSQENEKPKSFEFSNQGAIMNLSKYCFRE